MPKVLPFRPRAADVGPRIEFPGRLARFPVAKPDRLAAALRWSQAFVANGHRPPARW